MQECAICEHKLIDVMEIEMGVCVPCAVYFESKEYEAAYLTDENATEWDINLDDFDEIFQGEGFETPSGVRWNTPTNRVAATNLRGEQMTTIG